MGMTAGTTALTILGWTPGLHSLISGRQLPCGCLVGTYETWGRDVVMIVDAHSDACHDEHHEPNAILQRCPTRHPVKDNSSRVPPQPANDVEVPHL
jgi:hypothetical protein